MVGIAYINVSRLAQRIASLAFSCECHQRLDVSVSEFLHVFALEQYSFDLGMSVQSLTDDPTCTAAVCMYLLYHSHVMVYY